MDLRTGLTLRFEGERAIPVDSLGQIGSALRRLSTAGPSFLVLDAPDGDFAQAAGGNDAFTVEWRDRSGQRVAGTTGLLNNRPTAIPTRTSQVAIYENERLTAAVAEEILRAFAAGRARPARFAWRELHLRAPDAGQSGRGGRPSGRRRSSFE